MRRKKQKSNLELVLDAALCVRAKPDLTRISELTGVPLSTVHDQWKKVEETHHVGLLLTPKKEE